MTIQSSAIASTTIPNESTKQLWAALYDVEDPEFPMSIVDMGLVIDVRKATNIAKIKMTFTAMGCPCMDMIMEDVERRLLQETNIEQVDIEVVWSPVWTKDRLSERGREIMFLNGVTV